LEALQTEQFACLKGLFQRVQPLWFEELDGRFEESMVRTCRARGYNATQRFAFLLLTYRKTYDIANESQRKELTLDLTVRFEIQMSQNGLLRWKELAAKCHELHHLSHSDLATGIQRWLPPFHSYLNRAYSNEVERKLIERKLLDKLEVSTLDAWEKSAPKMLAVLDFIHGYLPLDTTKVEKTNDKTTGADVTIPTALPATEPTDIGTKPQPTKAKTNQTVPPGMCRFHVLGTCKKADCANKHDDGWKQMHAQKKQAGKLEICQFNLNTGDCTFGQNCLFSHDQGHAAYIAAQTVGSTDDTTIDWLFDDGANVLIVPHDSPFLLERSGTGHICGVSGPTPLATARILCPITGEAARGYTGEFAPHTLPAATKGVEWHKGTNDECGKLCEFVVKFKAIDDPVALGIRNNIPYLKTNIAQGVSKVGVLDSSGATTIATDGGDAALVADIACPGMYAWPESVAGDDDCARDHDDKEHARSKQDVHSRQNVHSRQDARSRQDVHSRRDVHSRQDAHSKPKARSEAAGLLYQGLGEAVTEKPAPPLLAH
jgi:hypothetical protein